MIIFKCKNKIFNELKWQQHDGWLYASPNDNYKLVAQHIYEVPNRSSVQALQFGENDYVYLEAFHPADLLKVKQVKGEPILLADGNEWFFKTIADINYRIVLDLNSGGERLEAFDPLFDYLLKKSQEAIDLKTQIDIAVEVLASQYYITRNLALAMGLFTTENLEKVMRTIFLLDKLYEDNFFRASTNENEIG